MPLFTNTVIHQEATPPPVLGPRWCAWSESGLVKWLQLNESLERWWSFRICTSGSLKPEILNHNP